MGSPPWAAYAQVELAESLLLADDSDRADVLAQTAADTAGRLAMTRLRRAAEQTLRAAGGEVARRSGPPATMRPFACVTPN